MIKMYNVRCLWLYILYINVLGEVNDEFNFDKIGVFFVLYVISSICNDERLVFYVDIVGDGFCEGGVQNDYWFFGYIFVGEDEVVMI